jgi:hypothetical protein
MNFNNIAQAAANIIKGLPSDTPGKLAQKLGDSSLAGKKVEGDFSRLSYDGLDLSGSKLASGTSFRGAELPHLNAKDLFINQTDFTGADLSGSNFNGIRGEGPNFNGADLSNAEFQGSQMFMPNLRGATIDGTDFSNTSMTEALVDQNTTIRLSPKTILPDLRRVEGLEDVVFKKGDTPEALKTKFHHQYKGTTLSNKNNGFLDLPSQRKHRARVDELLTELGDWTHQTTRGRDWLQFMRGKDGWHGQPSVPTTGLDATDSLLKNNAWLSEQKAVQEEATRYIGELRERLASTKGGAVHSSQELGKSYVNARLVSDQFAELLPYDQIQVLKRYLGHSE